VTWVRLWKDETGAAMVEFALVAAVFTFFLLGIMEAGLAAWQKNSAAADAREGARHAAVHGSRSGSPATSASVRNYVKTRTSLQITGSDSIRVYTVWPNGACPEPCMAPGSPVWVSVAHPVPRRGPFIPAHTDSATAKLIILF